VPIIRRNNCIYATLGICHSVWMTVWYAGWNIFFPPCIPDSHPYRVTNTKCHIDTVISPDDGHSRPKHVAKRNKHTKKIVHQVGFIYKTYRHLCVTSAKHSVGGEIPCIAVQCPICILWVEMTPDMRQQPFKNTRLLYVPLVLIWGSGGTLHFALWMYLCSLWSSK
jgi:hypothetical protein